MNNWPIFFLIIFLSACGSKPIKEEILPEQPIYSFAIAGHAYGNPESFTSSIYPPLLNALHQLTAQKKVNQLILTGDVVAHPTEENWETVRAELDGLSLDEWHIAPGNHDISPYMDAKIQPEKYMALQRANNLFLILNTSHEGWTVDSLQAAFIKKQLQEVDKINSIFVFSHQLWWLKDTPEQFELDSVRPNSFALYDGDHNFWEDVFPAFENVEQEVYFFAGDMGCHYSLAGYYEDHFNQFHFYGSGMGGAVEDNFIFVQVFQDGTVKIDRVDF